MKTFKRTVSLGLVSLLLATAGGCASVSNKTMILCTCNMEQLTGFSLPGAEGRLIVSGHSWDESPDTIVIQTSIGYDSLSEAFGETITPQDTEKAEEKVLQIIRQYGGLTEDQLRFIADPDEMIVRLVLTKEECGSDFPTETMKEIQERSESASGMTCS